jgi:hypothetical protein
MIWGLNLPGTPRATSACSGIAFTLALSDDILLLTYTTEFPLVNPDCRVIRTIPSSSTPPPSYSRRLLPPIRENIGQRKQHILFFHNDAHNYKITGILKQLKFRRSLRHVSAHAATIIREPFLCLAKTTVWLYILVDYDVVNVMAAYQTVVRVCGAPHRVLRGIFEPERDKVTRV